jgi:SAM-dependent MidA family methyltransferase
MNLKLGQHNLANVIQQTIQDQPGSMITFREFMNLCLYQEPYGYYRRSAAKIGPEGDFYTSSSVGTIMGEMIAEYVMKIWESHYAKILPFTIVEWGGGNGRLAVQLLDQLQHASPMLYKGMHYIMIESSSYHQKLQEETLHRHAGQVSWMTEENWYTSKPHGTSIILANELLDAFAIHRIRRKHGQIEENWVGWDDQKGEFTEHWLPLQNEEVRTYVIEEMMDFLLEGQIAEVNLESKKWISRMANELDRGQLIVIDYGDVAEELYAEHRMLGTLMCYRKHQAHDNPYEYVGEQDITAHVNFTACMHSALLAGLKDIKLVTQRQFLIDQGILNKLQNTFGLDPFSPEAKRNRSIRQLLISDSMSELFKVFIAHRQ